MFVIANNAANIQAALRKLPHYISLSCFNHTRQLAINDAVRSCSELDSTITNAKKITSFFKHSGQNASKLTKLKTQMGLPFKQECPTRWNSRYDMLDRLIKIKDAVSAIAASTNLTAEKWELAAEYAKFFQLFTVLTAVMSAASYPTVSRGIYGGWRVGKWTQLASSFAQGGFLPPARFADTAGL